jgi:hypothetical protein
MLATIMFDVEESYYPECHRLDDITVWMADTLAEFGLRGSFYFHGDHLRQLLDRGNTRVGQAMANHDIASHGGGNVHPVIAEVLEDKGWDDGLTSMRAYEEAITNDMAHCLGKAPAALSRHHFFTAQHAGVAGERGLPYMFACMPQYDKPVWYAGAVMFPYPDSPNHPTTRWLDESFYDDHAFQADVAALDTWLKGYIDRKTEYMTVFACHPARCMVQGWVEEACMVNGRMRSPRENGWLYAVRSEEDERRVRANFRKFAAYLASNRDLQIVGVAELGRRFSLQPEQVPRCAIAPYAEKMSTSPYPLLHEAFSPAEMTIAIAESLILFQDTGRLPDAVPRRTILGPGSSPIAGVERDEVTLEGLLSLSRDLLLSVEKTGQLPANLVVDQDRISVGQYLGLGSRAYAALVKGDVLSKLRNRKILKCPEYARALDGYARWLDNHPYLPPGFRTDQIALHLRLQTWTIKPARTSSDFTRLESGTRVAFQD